MAAGINELWWCHSSTKAIEDTFDVTKSWKPSWEAGGKKGWLEFCAIPRVLG